MALVVVATPGATNANSYLTLAEAETYFESRLHTSTWDNAVTVIKNEAIVMATRVIDQMYDWANYQTEEEQALQWPRDGMLAANEMEYIDDDVIPNELKNAVCELSIALIAEDITLDNDVEVQGLTSLRAGPVSMAFKTGVINKIIPDSVYYSIPEWWGHIISRKKRVHRLGRG
jgi:hypothetical protein